MILLLLYQNIAPYHQVCNVMEDKMKSLLLLNLNLEVKTVLELQMCTNPTRCRL